MNRKLDLDQYLAKYQSDQYKRKPIPNQQLLKYSSPSRFTPPPLTPPLQNPVTIERTLTSRQLITSEFHNSQAECLNFLQQIRRRLSEEQSSLVNFMETYQRQVEENLMKEHYRLREEFMRMLEKAFQENQRRVKDMLRGFGSNQPAEFTAIRRKIGQINGDIDRLEHGLRNTNYRPTIAEVVMSDFQSQTRQIQTLIGNAQRSLIENTSKIQLDEARCNRIRDDVSHLIIIDGMKLQQSSAPYIQVTQNNPQRRSRARLFDTAPVDRQGGSFFNFNN